MSRERGGSARQRAEQTDIIDRRDRAGGPPAQVEGAGAAAAIAAQAIVFADFPWAAPTATCSRRTRGSAATACNSWLDLRIETVTRPATDPTTTFWPSRKVLGNDKGDSPHKRTTPLKTEHRKLKTKSDHRFRGGSR